MANIFNAAQYLALYPALADYGYNESNAWDHFVQYGAAELRTPNDELKGKVYAESVLNYANGNPELAEAFGVVVPAESLTAAQQSELLLHYVMYGNAEERANKIIDAPEQSEDADLSDLRDALETVVAADADVKEAVEAAVEGLEITETEIEAEYENDAAKAVAGKYSDAAEIIQYGGDEEAVAEEKQNDDIAIAGFADVTDAAVRTQLIEAKQAQLANAEQVAAKELGADKAKVDAYLAAKTRVDNLTDRLDTAQENAENAGTLASAALTVANENTYIVEYDDGTNAFLIKEIIPAESEGDTETLVANVTLKIDPKTNQVDFDELVNGQAELAKVIEASPNYSSLTQSLQQVNALDTQLTNAKGAELAAYEKAGGEVEDDAVPETPAFDDENVGKYITAKDNVKEFAENVAVFRKTEAYQNAIDEANAAHEAAEEALKELGYEINYTGLGTPENDLFVYANENDTIFAFGEEGEDLFFFGDFAFVELKPNDDFAKGDFGDRNTLEIFAQQQGTDVVLYVEINEVGGNAFGIEENVHTVTLVGVNLEDLSFDSGAGFLVG